MLHKPQQNGGVFHGDHFNTTRIGAEFNLHRIWIMAETSFVRPLFGGMIWKKCLYIIDYLTALLLLKTIISKNVLILF